ncbi:hypothetical protein WICPIJ_004846 [Wickerhamomyces pijperi]|uniref:E3 ubiquitin protein ligase n=1 Tax=Wickerhamomyces pijperi TaxID=599730 RepID=A0A9P8Q506_WICPI|nr:hypothetical protein WICPIJ_004846 [Wickerhamomyces pijperi]
MSEKRTIDSDESANKKIKLDQLSESGPLTLKDVVYFQKEAIFRELNLVRAKCDTLGMSLKSTALEADRLKSRLSLIKNIVMSFVRYLEPVDKDNLLKDLEKLVEGESDDSLEQALAILSKFVSSLSGEIVPTSFSDISLKLAHIQTQYDGLALENKKLRETYTQLNEHYLQSVKENDRSNSKTLARIKPKTEETPTPDEVKESKSAPRSNLPTNTEKFSSEEISHKLDEYTATIETQKRLLDEQILSNQKLNEQINLLHQSKREEIEVKNSDVYLNLVKDYDTLNAEYAEINKKFEGLLEKFNKSEVKINDHHDSIVSRFHEEKEKVLAQCEKLEMDLTRIRTARDDLLAKVNILQSSKDAQEVIKDLNKTIETQKSVIDLFKFDSKWESSITADGGEEDIGKLKRSNTILINELKEFETLFKNLQGINFKKFQHIIENESILNKYRVEKKKADEKYFAVMRTKDSMTSEIKSLKDLNKKYELKISSIEDFRKHQDAEIANQINKNSSMERLVQMQKATIVKNDLNVTKLTNSLNLEVKKNLDSTNQLNELTASKTEYLSKISELELKLSTAESKNKAQGHQLSSRASQSSGSVELDSYRSLIYCSLCSKNWKNTAIKTCGHVFCKECTQERISARMRKCPTCNQPFSSNDILSIHL